MKARRLTVVAFLLVAVMIIGVGFATLTDKLDILGTAEISQSQAESTFDGDIYFDGFNASEGVTVAYDPTDTTKDTVSFNVATLSEVGATAVVTCTIKSEFAKKANLVAVLSSSRVDIFTVSTDWEDNESSIEANGTTTITVTIKLESIPSVAVSSTIDIKITATVPDATTGA